MLVNKGNPFAYHDESQLQLLKQKSSISSINSHSQRSLVNLGGQDYQGEGCVESILPLTAPQDMYALKMVELQELSKQKQIEHLFNERDILSRLQEQREQDLAASCFPKLYATFKSKMHVNFLMEPIEGITLFEFQREQVCIGLEQVKYFAAKTLVLLDYLHQLKIVFRDLKTENIMIDQNTADIKFVDFGFAKDLSLTSSNDRTYTKCGTPGYTAPEVLLQDEGSRAFNIRATSKDNSPQKVISSKGRNLVTHDFAGAMANMPGQKANQKPFSNESSTQHGGAGYGSPADVWSWGVLVCELIGGFNPFQGQSVQETFENISRININWPRNLDSASTQMLQAIFQRDPALRPTLSSIKRSSFFSGVNWNRLEATFEAARYETRTIVQSIYSGKKQSIRAQRNS